MDNFIDKFVASYGAAPTAVAEAPGRLEILGNHTDYNQGYVLSCAVAQNTKFALRPIAGTVCRIRDFRDGSEMKIDLADWNTPPPRDGSKYVKGMAAELMKRGGEIGAFDAALESDVPLSSGMSSSAALEISAGLAMGAAFGVELDLAEWARAGQGVENNYLGLKTGLLDQFSSLFGQKDAMILSDFRTVEVLRTVKLPPGFTIVVINSMKKHNLVDSEYNVRREDCETAARTLAQLFPGATTLRDISVDELAAARSHLGWREYRRALHVVGENARVLAGVRDLEEEDVLGFGHLWFESHESSRMNFENSTPELDYLVELAKSTPGCYGARLSGGGFGGITIHLVASDQAEEYAKRVCTAYRLRTHITPHYFICPAGDGAKVWTL